MIRLSFNQHNTSLADREKAYNNYAPFTSKQGVLLQTCNRIEFYEGDGEIPVDIVRHLFRVVSGLESNLLGENAIQGQVKTAYIKACENFKLSKGLHHLFQAALSTGKRVRSESGISKGAVSHSQAATELILQKEINLNKAIISIIGVHKLNEDIIRFLTGKGAETIFLASKTYDKAKEISATLGCQVMQLNQLKEMLQFTDILITATAAPHLIVKYEDFPAGKQMFIIDLAFPRDVDERIGLLPGVSLFNLENIEKNVQQNLDKRSCQIEIAEQIIEEEIHKFLIKQHEDANRQFAI